jgi:hypothetical protein
MQAAERMSLEQIQAFLEAGDEVDLKARNREEVYDWVNRMPRLLPPRVKCSSDTFH